MNDKPPLRLACVGDSITQGYGVASPLNSYPAQLMRLLGQGWQIRNFGVSGTTAMHKGDSPYIKTNEYRAALAFKPDVVVIALGTNDSKPQNFAKNQDDFTPSYNALIAAFREANPSVRICICLPPPAFPENFGITQKVITEEIIPRIKEIAASNKVELIDLHTPLINHASYFPDKVHPNEQGMRLLAEIVQEKLNPEATAQRVNLSDFDRRAREGEPLTVVFFGGSLTWGANASDPQQTSYRALMSKYLRERYPKSSFHFVDAAIGGTGSKLGLFRLDRDVLRHRPDLVFLDFTANDDLASDDAATLASYERILRELLEQKSAVMQVFFGFKWNFGKDWSPEKLLRRKAHLKLAAAYGTGVGDAFPWVQQRIEKGVSIEQLWRIDGAHPDDAGYQLFFEAVRDGFETAIRDGRKTVVPAKTVFDDRYPIRSRKKLIDGAIPSGWQRSPAFRTSMWFDGLSSRWIDDVVVFDAANSTKVEPLRIQFEGTLVGLLGEANQDGLSFLAWIDGKPIRPRRARNDDWAFSLARTLQSTGNLLEWRELADDLPPGPHELVIQPIITPDSKGQLRLESICVAGPSKKD